MRRTMDRGPPASWGQGLTTSESDVKPLLPAAPPPPNVTADTVSPNLFSEAEAWQGRPEAGGEVRR